MTERDKLRMELVEMESRLLTLANDDDLTIEARERYLAAGARVADAVTVLCATEGEVAF